MVETSKKNLIMLDFDGVINASKYAYVVGTHNYWDGVFHTEALKMDDKSFTFRLQEAPSVREGGWSRLLNRSKKFEL